MNLPLLTLKNVSKRYLVNRRTLYAVNDVSFHVFPGETVGLAGESGCGKSTIAKLIFRLTELSSGSIFFEDKEIHRLSSSALRSLRRRKQMIFQNPATALNPKMTIEEIIGEPLDIHGLAKGKERQEKIVILMDQVGLSIDYLQRLPHELSGGQKQRVNIARALAVQPQLIVCDEPLASLDRSIQKQIIALFQALQQKCGLTYLFISHDLSTMRYLTHRIAIMYLGYLVELAPTSQLYLKPQHPYTQALLSAIPIPDPIEERKRSRLILKGEVPSPFIARSGCPFYSRCPLAMPLCQQTAPPLKEIAPGHFVACHAK